MPIYEYHCEDCDRSFEALVLTGQVNETLCPWCGGMKLGREMSVFASRAGNTDAEANGGAPIPAGGSCCGGSCGCR
jgi:putative FmdB family regulatory protein